MTQKFMKASLSLLLTLSLVLLPSNIALANNNDNSPVAKEEATSNQNSTNDSDSIYDTAKEIAEKKASLLTSIYGVTSIQYALIDNGEIVLSGQSGVYSKESRELPTDTNMYGIGSISKIFTTIAVLQLIEEGKVDLNTPVVNYIKDFTMADSRYKDITVRMLLNHSSGLMGSTLDNAILFDNDDFETYDNFLNRLSSQRLKADPGAFSVYCNDGFTLAEVLVEKVTGQSFTDYIHENITKPLDLDNTKTPKDNFISSDLVKTYYPGGKSALPIDSLNMIGAGGMYSSAKDLCQLASIFMKDTSSVVLSNNLKTMTMNTEYLNGLWPDAKSSMLNYGLGWDSVNTYPFNEYGIKALAKGGDTLLFHGNLTVLPEENMAIAVLSSGGSSAYNQIMAQEILMSVLQSKGSIDEIKPDKTFEKPVAVDMPESQKEFAGIYALTGGVIKVDIKEDGTLTLTIPTAKGAGAQEFIYTGDGRFYYLDGSAYLSFVKEDNGNTYVYCEGYSQLPSLGQVITAEYQGQKLEDNPVSDDIMTAWEARNNKNYFMVSEKYSSELYALNSLSLYISLLDDIDGYCLNGAITNKYSAVVDIQIPGNYGRDLYDYYFFKGGKKDYLNAGGRIYISEDDITTLSTKKKFKVKIDNNGYAKWYKITEESALKALKVSQPDNASFSVYDSNGTFLMDSFLTDIDTVKLPNGGYIVFTGDTNTKFSVKYVNN